MLSISLKKYSALFIVPIVLLSVCIKTSIANSEDKSRSTFTQTFLSLIESASEENKHLLEGWNNYITKVTGYSNADLLIVIEELTMDYAQSYKEFDERYGADLDQGKVTYTSRWLEDLVTEFGEDFVCENKKAIILNLIVAIDRHDAKKFDQHANQIIGKEMTLYLAYQRYLDLFMQYYNQTSDKDRIKMRAWKQAAEKYLSITQKSNFAFAYYSKHMENKARYNAMLKENKELVMHFNEMKLPFGGGALSKAMNDIDKFVETCKAQGKKQPENDN